MIQISHNLAEISGDNKKAGKNFIEKYNLPLMILVLVVGFFIAAKIEDRAASGNTRPSKHSNGNTTEGFKHAIYGDNIRKPASNLEYPQRQLLLHRS